MTTLGSKLELILEVQRKADLIREENQRKEAEYRRIKKRNTMAKWVEDAKATIGNELTNGRIPRIDVYDNNIRSWIGFCMTCGNVDDQDLWDSLVYWLKEEGLRVKTNQGFAKDYSYDWLEVSVELIPQSEVEAD
jgi:hypothetical protein